MAGSVGVSWWHPMLIPRNAGSWPKNPQDPMPHRVLKVPGADRSLRVPGRPVKSPGDPKMLDSWGVGEDEYHDGCIVVSKVLLGWG